MKRLTATVRNGKLVMKGRRKLPEGMEFELRPVTSDGFSPEEISRINESIEASLEDIRKGRTYSLDETMAEYRRSTNPVKFTPAQLKEIDAALMAGWGDYERGDVYTLKEVMTNLRRHPGRGYLPAV